ncbi:tyrosine-type recombinase/integrase [Pseudomonas baetica]|uniref:tyrosine-type recombinase/integrase n=1 Tax=Pseudomonas baetica TaxID=674054 RepID=UPI003EF00721
MLAIADPRISNHESARQAFVDSDFSRVVFSFAQTPSGNWLVQSRFEDDVWIIPDAYFPSNVASSFKKLDFLRFPVQFRHIMKICVLKYFLFGIFNQGAPRGNTIVQFYVGALSFLTYISKHTTTLQHINPMLFSNYVKDCKSLAGRKSEKLSVDALRLRFIAVQTLHQLSQDTIDPMAHPWPDSSAATLAGKNGTAWYLKGKTPVIPDEILAPLFQSAVKDIERADELLSLRAGCDEILNRRASKNNSNLYTTPYLDSMGFSGGRRQLNKDLRRAYAACAIIILMTSGVRNHELLSIEKGCSSTTLDDDGNTIHWMSGRSEKTYEGNTEWIVTEVTRHAIDVATRISEPLRVALENDLKKRLRDNPECTEAWQLDAYKDAVFLGRDLATGKIQTISSGHLGSLINKYCQRLGLTWQFSPHQFRRTFAVYVVRSANGDIRYLKKHFKHWTLDMTALYASHEERDSELLDEVMAAYSEAKYEILDHVLDESTPLSGGLAEGIRKLRSTQVQTYASHSEMVKTVSDSVFIRSTSVAWCTNDLGNCVGGSGAESTRCGDCVNSLIDDTKMPIWQGIYSQQLELIKLTDIGASGIERVKRDMARCVKVLSDLGAPVGGEC